MTTLILAIIAFWAVGIALHFFFSTFAEVFKTIGIIALMFAIPLLLVYGLVH
jgi:hypothetical protein